MTTEVEAWQPAEWTLCPWRRIHFASLDADACIRLKDHDGEHDYRPLGHQQTQETISE